MIWSAGEHQWKQIRELPELLPSQKLAPAPQRRAQAPMLDNIEPDSPQSPVAPGRGRHAGRRAEGAARGGGPPRVSIPPTGTTPTPKIAQPTVAEADVPLEEAQVPSVRVVPVAVPSAEARPVAVAAAQVPSVRVASVAESRPVAAAAVVMPQVVQAPRTVAAVAPQAVAAPHAGHVVKEQDNFHPVKWICIILGVIIALVLAVNFLLINRPLSSSLGNTSYANVFVYAHYGAFVQPNVMVIHIPHSDKLTADNITDFLVALAQSTPKNPITNDYFDRIAITSAWTAQYSFSGSAWKSLGEMKGQSADDIRTQILSNGCDAGGQPLLGESTLSDAIKEERRDAAWKRFVANFTQAGS